MRRHLLLLIAVAALMAVSMLPAAAAPSNSPNSAPVVLDCGADGEITVFANFNSSGVALFEGDGKGRAYLISWYKFTAVEDPDIFFEKFYGERKGFDTTLTCQADELFEDPDSGLFFTIDVELKAK